MGFLKENYEKIVLGIAALLFGVFLALYFIADHEEADKSISTSPAPFLAYLSSSDSNASRAEIETRNPHGLMPGDFIELSGVEPEAFNKSYQVMEIPFPEEQEEITIRRRDGTVVTGFFIQAKGKLALGANPAKLKVTIEVDGSEVTVSGTEVARVKGSRVAFFAMDANASTDEASGEFSLVTYQPRHRERTVKALKPWKSPNAGDDNVSYDLFTPPRIFVVAGKLSLEPPKRPEALQEKEGFGVQLTSFENIPYRFGIKSWGADPFLYDHRIKRNVIVKVEQSYKEGKNWIMPCTEHDPDKIIKILAFKTESLTDKKSGGTRLVASLKLFDFSLGQEIAMTNTKPALAGQLAIKVSSTLPDAAGETQDLTERSTEFFLGGKEYRILKIDPIDHSLLLVKLADNPKDNQQELLRLSTSSDPTPKP